MDEHAFHGTLLRGGWEGEKYCQNCGLALSNRTLDVLNRRGVALPPCGFISASTDTYNPRSQKARGVKALSLWGISHPPAFLVQREEEVISAIQRIHNSDRLFVRPCPVRPRHGFVDSRPVSLADGAAAVEEVLNILEETRRADPEGELLIMPAINASHSAVWRPGLLAIGPSNDGATSGRGTITLPLVPTRTLDVQNLAKHAGIEEDDPYIEVVYDGLKHYYTQVRGGPRVSSHGPNFVPNTCVVQEVVEAEGDLLEWETRARSFSPGTVVYHPGGSLASHYAVHCVLNNIPLLVTYKPPIGAVLEPTVDREPLDPEAARAGVAAASRLDLIPQINTAQAVGAVAAILHNAAVFQGADAFWIGAAAELMQRLGTAAAIGELRHKHSAHRVADRNRVYSWALGRSAAYRRRLPRAVRRFEDPEGWPSRAYGGEAWAACTRALIKLDRALWTLMHEPSLAAVQNVTAALNTAVNMAHNHGWWLNKYAPNGVLDGAASGDPRVLLDAVPILWDIHLIPPAARRRGLRSWHQRKALAKSKSLRAGGAV